MVIFLEKVKALVLKGNSGRTYKKMSCQDNFSLHSAFVFKEDTL
jgi:hypothetical protein